MRLFAAVLPPEQAVSQLALVVEPLHALPGAAGLRWTDRPGWHFTLAFLGEVDDALVPAVEDRLAQAARDHRPFGLGLAGGGCFGRRSLWAGATGEVAAMARLAAAAERAARDAGVRTEDPHPYVPHLTLARNDARTDLRPYAEALDGFTSDPWTVRELALVRSGGRPRYQVVAAWPLGPGK
ncbi:RNA 2',3'-cyclic phosphodiesterase [Streptomyces sp. NBC_01387]|uniref:RNA 2',3'-cyclic phosphodiesterase n=1 Tax=unclassified Streptomyces TaxID=2593676 RepID=UPI00225AEAC0|nr:RNA 2',3'-cyclic phosphodiesterase [Streptomyces sp. NBC_01500]MCX4550134.1 RNA 2',3'-cyclic phosphodiesterase [Streptomyces sp. NBC_01500]